MNEELNLKPGPAGYGPLFWLRWTLLTALGYSIGFLAGFVLGHLAGHAAVGAVVGAATGWLQSRRLDRVLRRPWLWTLAAAAGPAVAGLAFDIAFHGFGGKLGFVYLVPAAGALSALLQSRLLRLGISSTLGWIVTGAAGWGLSLYGFSLPLYKGGVLFVILRNALLPGALAGVILGALSGLVLILLLRCRRHSPETNIAPAGTRD